MRASIAAVSTGGGAASGFATGVGNGAGATTAALALGAAALVVRTAGAELRAISAEQLPDVSAMLPRASATAISANAQSGPAPPATCTRCPKASTRVGSSAAGAGPGITEVGALGSTVVGLGWVGARLECSGRGSGDRATIASSDSLKVSTIATGGAGRAGGGGAEARAGGGFDARCEGGGGADARAGGAFDARDEGGGGGTDGRPGREAGPPGGRADAAGSPNELRPDPRGRFGRSAGRCEGSGDVSSFESTVASAVASSGIAFGISSHPPSTSDVRGRPGFCSWDIPGRSLAEVCASRPEFAASRGAERWILVDSAAIERRAEVTNKIAVVLNPNARGGRRAMTGRARRLERLLGWRGTVYATRSLDELGGAVHAILADPPAVLVTDGGDGTLHWVLNEARKLVRDVAQLPPLLPTNGGTIDFVARKVGIAGHAESIVAALIRELDRDRMPELVELDSLWLTGEKSDGEGFDRLGFALAAGGIGQRFFSKYYEEKQLVAGAIVRVVAKAVASRVAGSLRAPLPDRLLDYGRDVFRPTSARVTIDGQVVPGTAHGAIHAGAMDLHLGGVFRVFPLARDDGALHFQAGEIVPHEMILALPALARGGAIPSERLREVRGREMSIEAIGDEDLAPIIDGEAFAGLRNLTVRLGPRIRVPRVRG